MRIRLLERVHLLVLSAYVVVAIAFWKRLPAELPLHFDFIGRATTWTRTSPVVWFLLPCLAIGLALMIRGLQALARSTPEMQSVPEKERFLALSPTARAPIEAELAAMAARVSLLVTLLLVAVHAYVYMTAVAAPAHGLWITRASFVAILVVILVLAVRSRRRVRVRILAAATLPARDPERG